MEEFLKAYKRARGYDSRHYADYVRTRGEDSGALYTDAVADASHTYDHALASYGAGGEALARQGGAAGYAAYLDKTAKDTLDANMQAARDTYTEASDKNRTGYADYLAKGTDRIRRIISDIYNNGIYLREDAYAYALSAGADEENAYLIADLIDGMEDKQASVKEMKARARIFTEMLTQFLPRDAAYEYARACGIRSDIAMQMAESAEKIITWNQNIKY